MPLVENLNIFMSFMACLSNMVVNEFKMVLHVRIFLKLSFFLFYTEGVKVVVICWYNVGIIPHAAHGLALSS